MTVKKSQPSPLMLVDLTSPPTALKMLTEGEERLRSRGVLFWLAGLSPEMLRIIRRSPLGETLGRERMFFDVATAVRHYLKTWAQR
jgi:hypothetical protein